MVRECLALALLAALCPGCSLILDFSSSAAPADAAIDAPYTAADCAYDEPNNTFATAAMITPGTDTGPAAICPVGDAGSPDLDYYRFTVPMGTTTVTVSITFTDALGDLDLDLYDGSSQALIAASRTFNNGETITCGSASTACPTLAPGDYVFEVFPATVGNTNAYTFDVVLQ